MSLQSSLLKIILQLSTLKRRVAHRSLETIQKMNVPIPPDRIYKNGRVEKVVVNDVNSWWLNKDKLENGFLFYIHGGGYTFGPVDFQWDYIAQMSQLSGMAALLIDYRMSPTHPYPAGLEDVIHTLEYLKNSGELPQNWFLLGDSAGAGLCLATTYKLREQQMQQPAKMLLISPWLDVSGSNPDLMRTAKCDPVVSLEILHKLGGAYSGKHDMKNPLISPMYGDLRGLPPTLLQTGTSELLLADCRKFHQKCLEAGVKIQYEEYTDQIHAFALMNFLPEAQQAQAAQVAFLKG